MLPSLDDIKGEFVIVVDGFKNDIIEEELGVVGQVDFYIENGMKAMDAIKLVAQERGLKKNDVYAEYHRGDRK